MHFARGTIGAVKAMNKVAISFCAAMLLCMSYVYAQQPTFPFLQDGGARNSYVQGAINTCLKTQTAAPENQGISQDRIVKFCNCYARAIADVINGQEYEALVAGQVPESFGGKVKTASTLCATQSDN
jgi:hypothetical protein